jgi:hypothetical protein
MIAANWLVIKCACKALIGDGRDGAWGVTELNEANHGGVHWQVSTSKYKFAGAGGVGEGCDFALWLNVMIIAIEVLANGGVLANPDLDLRCGLVCSQHFERNGLVEDDVVASIDVLGVVRYHLVTCQWIVNTGDDSHLLVLSVHANETSIPGNTILIVAVGAGSPHVNVVVSSRTVLEDIS